MDRVAIVALVWFAAWTTGGTELSKYLFNDAFSGAIWGFIFALMTVFAWPLVLPPRLERWMHDPRP